MNMWVAGFGAALGSLGFGYLFHVKGYKILITALIGGVGGFVYTWASLDGHSTVVSLFFASMAVSLLSEISSRYFKCPVTSFLICALIPLVPGGHMYYTMLEVVNGNTDLAMYKAIDTCAQACSIAMGFILVSSIVRTYTHIKQRIGKHV